MTKSTAVRKLIRELLNAVYLDERLYEGFNTGTKIPKVNYKLIFQTNEDSKDSIQMEINIWTRDSLYADQIADDIEEYLDFLSIVKYGCYMTLYMDSRKSIDEKNDLERRMLTFSIENYYMEVQHENNTGQ